MKLSQKDMIYVFGYTIIIILLIVILVKGPNVDCNCKFEKKATAPFHSIPNPANMNNQETTNVEQTLMNIKGCTDVIGGTWEQRPGGTGVCQNWQRLGPPLE